MSEPTESATAPSTPQQNPTHLYCVRCPCLIMRANTATFSGAEKIFLPKMMQRRELLVRQHELREQQLQRVQDQTTEGMEQRELPPLDESMLEGETLAEFWQVSDVFAFDNVGVSNTVGGTIKYLTCSDCEIGPIGWHDTTDKKKYLLACSRVQTTKKQ